MATLNESQERIINSIYTRFGGSVSKCFIKFALLISLPGRSALKIALLQAKASYQSQLTSIILRNTRATRLLKTIQTKVDLARTTLDSVQPALNIAALAKGILDNPCTDIEKMTTLLGVNFPKVPGLNFGGYDGAASTLSAVNYELNRVQNAVNIGESASLIINDKIKVIDSVIEILDSF